MGEGCEVICEECGEPTSTAFNVKGPKLVCYECKQKLRRKRKSQS